MQQTAIANSTIAGVVSYPVIASALTAALTILGIVIPPFMIGGLAITQTMDISAASTVLSYVITHFTSDSVQQQIASLAKLAPRILAAIPNTYSQPSDFPNPPPNATSSNIVKAEAAIAVIQAHTMYPTDKGGV